MITVVCYLPLSNLNQPLTAISAAIALKVGFTTATADVINTWSRQDNYILCTHMKMKTIVKHIQWKCISTVSHDKSSRNKESCGLNVSCMLYSFKIVFPTRQVLFTSAVAVVKPTFHAITTEIAVSDQPNTQIKAILDSDQQIQKWSLHVNFNKPLCCYQKNYNCSASSLKYLPSNT